jgi:hypothetical protein
LRFRAAIVGPHGRGKTTLLEDLGRRLEERGFRLRRITLHQSDRRLTGEQSEVLNGLRSREVLCLDGAEQLGLLAWRRVERRSRAAAGLLITSHRPRLLPTLVECETSPELLTEILRDLLGTETGDLRLLSEDLFSRHRGNLRDALRELYDLHAGR